MVYGGGISKTQWKISKQLDLGFFCELQVEPGPIWQLATPSPHSEGENPAADLMEPWKSTVGWKNVISPRTMLWQNSHHGDTTSPACPASQIIPPLLVFGEQPDGKDLEDGDVQLCFGRVLPLLLATWGQALASAFPVEPSSTLALLCAG